MILRPASCSAAVPLSQRPHELGAARAKFLDQRFQRGVVGVLTAGAFQIGGQEFPEFSVRLRSMAHAGSGTDECAPGGIQVFTVPFAHEGRVEGVGEELGPGRVVDGDGGGDEPVEDAVDAGCEVAGDEAGARRRQSCQAEQVLPLARGEAEGAGEGLDHLGGGVGGSSLFQADDVVGGDLRASWESSSRRRPGARLRLVAGRPTVSGVTRSRQARRAPPSSV